MEPGKPKDLDRRVYLSPKAKRERDAYTSLVVEIEQNWRSQYGADSIDGLRAVLEQLNEQFGTKMPDYPDTTRWYHELHARNSDRVGQSTRY